MGELLQKHLMELLCTGFLATATWFGRKIYQRLVYDQDAIKESVLAINSDRLRQACRYHLSNNKITMEELQSLEYLYNGYHALGGNQTATELYKRCQKLKIEMEEVRDEDQF